MASDISDPITPDADPSCNHNTEQPAITAASQLLASTLAPGDIHCIAGDEPNDFF